MKRVLVVGLAVTGRAVVDALLRRDVDVVAVDDRPTEAATLAASDRGIELVEAPSPDELRLMLEHVDAVVPSPGVPRHHPVYALADELGVPVMSEFDLAARWDDRPIVAITGTNGKTTVTTLVTAMMRAAGIGAVAAGNVDVPLVEAIDRNNADVAQWFVVEASSFRLERVDAFAPRISAWLNLAPDHLDWHPDMESYRAAKARIWRNHTPTDVKIIPADDADIAELASAVPGITTTFGLDSGDVHVRDGALMLDSAEPPVRIVEVADLIRRLPHDLENAAAAAACAISAGVPTDVIGAELAAFVGLAHRMSLVGHLRGVPFYNDSKATTPEATIAAVQGFSAAALIAGGRNKGLDLDALARAARHLSVVIAIGEAADVIAEVFTGKIPVHHAVSMEDAVMIAIDHLDHCDAVVLSPSCASFDWYRNYAERGDDFVRIVERASKEDVS